MEKYNVIKAIESQREYCKKEGLPHFAPRSGRCYKCNKNIYELIQDDGKKYAHGISVEKASSELITGCPHCSWSYCD